MRLITLSALALSAMVSAASAQQPPVLKCPQLDPNEMQALANLIEAAAGNPKFPAGGIANARLVTIIANKMELAPVCPPPPAPPAKAD